MLSVDAAKRISKSVLAHRYGVLLFAFIAAAGLTGVACVWFMWGFDFVLSHRITGAWRWAATPALFIVSVEMIRRFAPAAAGTGIPQAIFASQHGSPEAEAKLAPLTSAKTLTVKILSLYIGLLAGASTGREGPTVHVAACIFVGLILFFRSVTGLKVDLRSAVIAGGAAGLAAAFNTPLAGVTFAIEELTGDYFGGIKEFVIMAIIIAAITAKGLTGEYTYFGRMTDAPDMPLTAVLLIGLCGGLLGAFFSTAILKGQRAMEPYHKAHRYAVPALLAIALLCVSRISTADVLGPGNEAAQELVRGHFGAWAWGFPFEKMAATLLTYWSGIAGGIFAPSLSIGAALGSGIGRMLSVSIASCALVGMAAFLSGTIQAPITAFVIIFEMTGHHQMLPPIMMGALLGFMVARLVGAEHLYQALSRNYAYLLE
jgi:H+/Cl- antiporter ClcA